MNQATTNGQPPGWTPEYVGSLVGGIFNGAWKIAEAHNAELAAKEHAWNLARLTDIKEVTDKAAKQLMAMATDSKMKLDAERKKLKGDYYFQECMKALQQAASARKQLRETIKQLAAEKANYAAWRLKVNEEHRQQLAAEREKHREELQAEIHERDRGWANYKECLGELQRMSATARRRARGTHESRKGTR